MGRVNFLIQCHFKCTGATEQYIKTKYYRPRTKNIFYILHAQVKWLSETFILTARARYVYAFWIILITICTCFDWCKYSINHYLASSIRACSKPGNKSNLHIYFQCALLAFLFYLTNYWFDFGVCLNYKEGNCLL